MALGHIHYSPAGGPVPFIYGSYVLEIPDGGFAPGTGAGVYTSPPTTGWSWVNQGSATVDTSSGDSIYLLEAGRSSGTDFHLYVRTAPSAPYTIDVFVAGLPFAKDYTAFGLVWRQSSDGKFIAVLQQHVSAMLLALTKFNSPTSASTSYTTVPLANLINWLRLEDDNTDRVVSVSVDGVHWSEVHRVGRTDFLTADQVGIVVSAENASSPYMDAAVHLRSWVEA